MEDARRKAAGDSRMPGEPRVLSTCMDVCMSLIVWMHVHERISTCMYEYIFVRPCTYLFLCLYTRSKVFALCIRVCVCLLYVFIYVRLMYECFFSTCRIMHVCMFCECVDAIDIYSDVCLHECIIFFM